jgi:hypothetical protein
MSNGDHPEPQATANSGAVAVVGLDLRGEEPAPKKQIYSWALWDWATQPFHSVILTFIFTALYLTSDAFLPAGLASLADKDWGSAARSPASRSCCSRPCSGSAPTRQAGRSCGSGSAPAP